MHNQDPGYGYDCLPEFDVGTVDFDSIAFTRDTVDSASRRLVQLASAHAAVAVRLVNAFSIASSHESSEYRRTITSPGINYADGAPVARVLSRISERQGVGPTSRVRGPSLFEQTLLRSQNSSVTHFFFGSSTETLSSLSAEIQKRYPQAKVAGFVSPPIAPPEELIELAAEAHAESGGDIVWLGLGTPKQDIVAHQLAQRIRRPCVGVGAAFDFVAGTQPVAPLWMQSSGLEWLFRLSREPRRLWRRYTLGNIGFARVALRELGRAA